MTCSTKASKVVLHWLAPVVVSIHSTYPNIFRQRVIALVHHGIAYAFHDLLDRTFIGASARVASRHHITATSLHKTKRKAESV